MFGKFKDMLKGAAGKLTGKTDLMEGIAAGSILVAAADGELDSAEIGVIVEALQNHDTISKAFTAAQIEQTVQKMITLASPNAAGKIGLMGKMKLEKEVAEVGKKSGSEDIQMMLAIMTDVASADADGVEPSEKAVINKISASLGQGAFL